MKKNVYVYKFFAILMVIAMTVLMVTPLNVSAYDRDNYDVCYKLSSMSEEDVADLIGQYMVIISFRRQEIFLEDRESGLRTKILYTNADVKDIKRSEAKRVITFIGEEYSASVSIEEKTGKPFLTFVHTPSGYEEKYLLSNQDYTLPDLNSGEWKLNNVSVPLPEFTLINEDRWEEYTIFIQRENFIRYAKGDVTEIFHGTVEGVTITIYVDKNGDYFYELEEVE